MPYRFATQPRDYSDLAGGRVLYSRPGYPAFPVRLASEIFQRCLSQRAGPASARPVTLYDPCCGGAYHLSALALEHWAALQMIIGSDIDPQAVQLAARNLGLLTPDGLDQRIRELTAHYQAYGKDSHRAALQSAQALRERVGVQARRQPLPTRVFQASAFDASTLRSHLGDTGIDVVLTDIPYGRQSAWADTARQTSESPVSRMLTALRSCLHTESVVAIASDKSQVIASEGYARVERFQVGRRQIVLLRPRPE